MQSNFQLLSISEESFQNVLQLDVNVFLFFWRSQIRSYKFLQEYTLQPSTSFSIFDKNRWNCGIQIVFVLGWGDFCSFSCICASRNQVLIEYQPSHLVLLIASILAAPIISFVQVFQYTCIW